MSEISKVEMTYTPGEGATLDSQFEDEVDELVLASMLVETIAIRHGLTNEQITEIILGMIDSSEPMHFNIIHDLRKEGAGE